MRISSAGPSSARRIGTNCGPPFSPTKGMPSTVNLTVDTSPKASRRQGKGKAMPRYWVYENWTRKRARMHLAECRFCKDGHGVQRKISENNGRWLGPFSNRSAALKALAGTKQPDRRACEVCGPD